MTFKEMLKKAKEGGYETPYGFEPACIQERVLLDPKFFQAVGKVEGWRPCEDFSHPCDEDGYLFYMHQMIDALADGKSLEEFIETL